MDILKINKAFNNKVRLYILQWLKEPEKNFPPHTLVDGFENGVCVDFIYKKSKMSQSTISHYLSILENAQLIILTRIGKYSFYKRNESTIQAYIEYLKTEL